ncbi:glycosyltransferase [Moraxella osloensis]
MLLSIIVPVFNQEKYLTNFFSKITSFYNVEHYFDFEVIFVDDGSTDNSRILIEEFIKANININCKYLSKENGGVSSARNFGIDSSNGDYLWLVDCDDDINLQELNNVLSSIHLVQDVLIFDFYKEDTINKQSVRISGNFNSSLLCFEKVIKSGLLHPVWNKIYRKSLLIEHNIKFNEKYNYAEDLLFNLDVILNTDSVSFIHTPIYIYYIRDSSLSTKYIYNLPELIVCVANKYRELHYSKRIDIDFVFKWIIIDSIKKIIANNLHQDNQIDKCILDLLYIFDRLPVQKRFWKIYRKFSNMALMSFFIRVLIKLIHMYLKLKKILRLSGN